MRRVAASWLAEIVWVLSSSALLAQANPQAPPPGTRLRGIYRATATNGAQALSQLTIADPAKHSPGYSFLVFFPDGRVKKGLIDKGIDDEISESSMRLDLSSGGIIAAQWGVYQIVGDRGMIQFASTVGGQQLVSGLRGPIVPLLYRRDTVVVNGVTYVRLDGGGDGGLKLEGVYKPAGDTTQPGIKFTRDGQFIDQGILDSGTGMAIAMGGVAYGFDSPKAGRGAYVISHYGLHLSYTNGQSPGPLFYLEPDAGRSDIRAIYINNFRYERVQ